MKKRFVLIIVIALGVLLTGAPDSGAYLEYADQGNGGCDNCHGAFLNSTDYMSLVDGGVWNSDLMDAHSAMVSTDCNICHLPGQDFPVFLNNSGGGIGPSAIGCVGCHGRAEDRGTESDCVDPGNPRMPCGDGAGLRQHHLNADPFAGQVCLDCHADTDPANYTPVNEDVKPPFYFLPDPVYTSKPTDPCNPNGEEDYEGTTRGLDNDGDLLYDRDDCFASTPGDCNGDGMITAGDISALVLEIFDGDGNLPADTPGGTFPGDPVGSDANEDGIVSAGDISCLILIIFNGPGACSVGPASASASAASEEPLYGTAQTDPEEGPVDLDIVEVQLSGNGKTGEAISKIRVTLMNANGRGEGTKPATLIGVQGEKEVYNETRMVFDLSSNGRARFAFPSYTPMQKGTIIWTLEIFDDDPDNDRASTSTRVR